MNARERQINLLRRMVKRADEIVATRTVSMGDAAISAMREEIEHVRGLLSDEPNLIGYEVSCLFECIVALVDARSEHNRDQQARAITHINSFVIFLRTDLFRVEIPEQRR